MDMMKKFNGIWNAKADKRYKTFVTTAADTESVWLCKKSTIHVWPGKEYALRLFPENELSHWDVHDFCALLSDMSKDRSSIICVFPTDKDYLEAHPQKLLMDLQEELDRLE